MGNALLISIGVGACMLLAFLFSGMEAGVLALNRLRIRQYARAGNRRAAVLHHYLEQPENFLWTILIGNTLSNFLSVGAIVVLLHRWLGSYPILVILGFLVAMFLFYTFCELLPKMLFRAFPNRLCMAVAIPFRLIHLVLSPLVALTTNLSKRFQHLTGGKTFTGNLFGSREEMRMVMQESSQGLTSEERLMINRVLDLQNISVRQVAIPLSQTVTVPSRMPMSEVLKLAREKKITRLPVREAEGRGRIVGMLSLRTTLYQADLDENKPAGDYVKPALYIEENMRLEEALKRMQRSGHRLAIVLGRDQREVGVVSLEDILKVIFGQVSL